MSVWTCSSISKFRNERRNGDDVVVSVPGFGAAVFDGVTNHHSLSPVMGSSGRRAALAAASTLLKHWETVRDRKSGGIVEAIQSAVGQVSLSEGCTSKGATTGAIVFEERESFQLIIVGDTSIRINGDEVYRQSMRVDDVTISARTKLFQLLARDVAVTDTFELTIRKIMFEGFSHSVNSGLIDRRVQSSVIDYAVETAGPDIGSDVVVSTLNMGLQQQSRFANSTTGKLGYSVFDGSSRVPSALIVDLDRSDVDTIEIFSDGYQCLPNGTSCSDWECAYQDVERTDPHRIKEFPAIKGTTGDFWFDDRSIAVWRSLEQV